MLRLCGAELDRSARSTLLPIRTITCTSARPARRPIAQRPSRMASLWANQFEQRRQSPGHIVTTGPEIWQQTDGKVDGFICAVGTGGTLAGVAMALKERNNEHRDRARRSDGRSAVQLFTPRRAQGRRAPQSLKASAKAASPRISRTRRSTPPYQIPDAEAVPFIFDLLEHEGLCLGGSSGINVAGAVRLAKELGPGHTIVTILADYGTRYQSKLFNPQFLREKSYPSRNG